MRSQTVKHTKRDPAYERAMEITDQEWLKAGATREELDRSQELTNIFDHLMGSGYSKEIVRAAWEAEYPDVICLYLRLLAIAERALPMNGSTLAQILHHLAKQYHARGDYAAAEAYYARLLTLCERTLEADHPLMIATRQEYTQVLQAVGRENEAELLVAV